MSQTAKKITWTGVLILIAVLALLFFVLPKQEYSALENRYLEAFPKLSLEKVSDASFMKELASYLCDHFPARDLFMTVRTRQERLMGKNLINGIYLCEDGFYIEQYQKPENTERIVAAFKRLNEKTERAKLLLMLVPTAVTVYENKLPKHAVNASQTEEMARIYEALSCKEISVTDALLSERDEAQLFYKLDHHWTGYGAYLAYRCFCEETGKTPKEREEFTVRCVSKDFQGTIYSKLNDALLGQDDITVFLPHEESLTVSAPDTGDCWDSLYAEEYLSTKDQYSYFLHNIHPMLEITNHLAETKEELVVIKDSYANSMIPFLVAHYAKIYVVDTRYYKQSVTKLINEKERVSEVLVLYNMNTIDDDLGIGGIY